jgi:hypothetical protein
MGTWDTYFLASDCMHTQASLSINAQKMIPHHIEPKKENYHLIPPFSILSHIQGESFGIL